MASSSISKGWTVPARVEPLDRYELAELEQFACALFMSAGLDDEKAETTARLLLCADAMGHSTHGLAHAAAYLVELDAGGMSKSGQPHVLRDRGACVLWDGRRLPGLWLTEQAIHQAIAKASVFGTGTVAIRGSHHIGALLTLLEPAAAQGYLVMITTSDPAARTVAPFGATEGVLSTNPIAMGIPTSGDPILIDMSTAITTAAAVKMHREAGSVLPGPWLAGRDGHPTDRPEDGVALLPIGGADHGHKGLALSLMIEALTSGLTGAGRAQGTSTWGGNVLVQVWDPEFFAGSDILVNEMSFTASACRDASGGPIRLPGEAAQGRRHDALTNGIWLKTGIIATLESWARRSDIVLPRPLGDQA